MSDPQIIYGIAIMICVFIALYFAFKDDY